MSGSVRAGALQGFDARVRAAGGDPRELVTQVGLDPEALLDPEAMIPLDAVAVMLETVAQRFRLPDFGLQLGGRQDPAMLGLLAVVVQHAATVEQALRDAARYLFVHSPSYELAVEDPSLHIAGCVTVRFDVDLGQSVPQRQLIDGCLASTYRMAQLLAPAPVRLQGVSVPHTPAVRREAYRDHFGAPVHFEQPFAGLHFDRAILGVGMGSVQPFLHDRAVAYLASRHPAGSGVAARVRSTLKSTVGVNRGTKREIAGLLDLHPRTLQRRLSAESVTFEEIRDDVYRSATARMLRDTEIPLGQVAAALGFSEQSAMTSSVRRWFGTTPTDLRRRTGA